MMSIKLSVGQPISGQLADLLGPKLTTKLRRRIAREVIPPMERLFDRTIRREVASPDHPIDWTSLRQKRFVLRKLRILARQQGRTDIRYIRTGATAAAWEIALNFNEGVVDIDAVNPLPHAVFVYGKYQQRFLHKWPRIDDLADEIAAGIDDDIVSVWEGILTEVS
jgi:hypothetical protein